MKGLVYELLPKNNQQLGGYNAPFGVVRWQAQRSRRVFDYLIIYAPPRFIQRHWLLGSRFRRSLARQGNGRFLRDRPFLPGRAQKTFS